MIDAWKVVTVSAITCGYALSIFQNEYKVSAFLKGFLVAVLLEIPLRVTFNIILYPRIFSPLRDIPTPGGRHWLWGHGMRLYREPYCSPVREWCETVANDGLVRYFGFFNAERIVVTSPEALHEVLVTKNYSFPKPASLRETASKFLGLGLILSEGDAHKVQRRGMNPAFAPRNIKSLYPLFWRKTLEMIEKIINDQKTNDGVVEVTEWASRTTLDLIGLAGLGRDFGAIQNKESKLVKTYETVFKPSQQARVLHMVESLVPAWVLAALPIKLNSDMGRAAGYIREICRESIVAKQKKLPTKTSDDSDIMSEAIRTGTFTEQGLIDQAMTLLAAGHDTTGSAFTWGIYLLASYPRIQARLRQEIREWLPSLKEAETSEDCHVNIDSMPYLQAVCNEILRFYAPVPQTLREAAHDTTIAGHFIPKGTRIVITPWAMNRDPRLWGSDSHEFNPDRWLNDENDASTLGGASSKYGLLSFLRGPRACIGQGFARAELAILLAGWVGSFDFQLRDKELMDESNLNIAGGLTARPADGLYVKLKANLAEQVIKS